MSLSVIGRDCLVSDLPCSLVTACVPLTAAGASGESVAHEANIYGCIHQRMHHTVKIRLKSEQVHV